MYSEYDYRMAGRLSGIFFFSSIGSKGLRHIKVLVKVNEFAKERNWITLPGRKSLVFSFFHGCDICTTRVTQEHLYIWSRMSRARKKKIEATLLWTFVGMCVYTVDDGGGGVVILIYCIRGYKMNKYVLRIAVCLCA